MRKGLEPLRKQGVVLNEEQLEKMLLLDSMVVKWNQAAGLIGFQSAEERLDRYFGEALHASMWLPEQGKVVDVGSGGGTPALPMAVCHPELEWTLLEPNQKKAVFLQEACARLELDNIEVVRSRFQEFECGAPVSAITTRGLALDYDSLKVFRQWLQPSGKLLIFTGDRKGEAILEGDMMGWKIEKKQLLAPRFQAVLVVLGRD